MTKFLHKPALNALLLLLLISVCAPASSADFNIGASLALGDDLQTAQEKLQKSCSGLTVAAPGSPRYPLAASREQHLICTQYQFDGQSFAQAALVFADDRLVQMEATGIDVAALAPALGESSARYLGMDIYDEGNIWLDREQARLVWLNKQARHPNLFAWRNPYLHNQEYDYLPASIETPALLDFDSDLRTLRPKFTQQCAQVREENQERIWLPNKPKVQIQINCFGYVYAGFERKFEAVFGDGKLHVVWILTGKAEESRLRNLLKDRWGEPSIETEKWEVFNEGRVSLRKDKPELLLLSDQIIPLYKEELESP